MEAAGRRRPPRPAGPEADRRPPPSVPSDFTPPAAARPGGERRGRAWGLRSKVGVGAEGQPARPAGDRRTGPPRSLPLVASFLGARLEGLAARAPLRARAAAPTGCFGGRAAGPGPRAPRPARPPQPTVGVACGAGPPPPRLVTLRLWRGQDLASSFTGSPPSASRGRKGKEPQAARGRRRSGRGGRLSLRGAATHVGPRAPAGAGREEPGAGRRRRGGGSGLGSRVLPRPPPLSLW